MILQRKKFITMIHDIHENNKLSNQLEFLRNQLLREAEERQAAEEVHNFNFFFDSFAISLINILN